MVEDIGNAARADDGTRQNHGHEGAHHDGGEDLEQVLEESSKRADFHQALVDAVAAKPQDRARGDVEDDRDDREHEDEQLAHLEREVGEVAVGFAETFGLVLLAGKSADDADAGDLLAQGAVHGVELVLPGAEERHEAHDDR